MKPGIANASLKARPAVWVTLALVVLPSFASATCSSDQHAMSCAEGTVYDAERGSCVSSVNS
ncbi:MAG: hypothetical protein ACU0FF_10945 [Sulfitobacter sp.]|jgi:hypothetical protein|uniref:hypothetical protein n=1 Tax=Sulfitobacter sp. TaxID=1903071 RepID=UPI000C0F8951|nr:hypothetical protein [Roseobacter sp.]PHR00278.1 MAG: hypothetical protein COB29_15955 [Sulfitobacter sp.]